MNHSDHDLALHVFQTLHSIAWDVMTIMNQWSSATPGDAEQDESETIAFESEVKPLLCNMIGALEKFPTRSFNAWKLDVLKELTEALAGLPIDPATRKRLKDEPQGVAIACDEALEAVTSWTDEVLQRLGACGWHGMMTAWDRTLRSGLSRAESRLSEAIEQLTVNPMFGPFLRERALRMIDVTGGETTANESSANVQLEPQDAPSPEELTWDDEEVTTDLTQIDPEFRTKTLGKAQAAAYFGRTGDAGRKWLNQCIKDGTITCVQLTRQSYVFDWREFPSSAIAKVRPTSSTEESSAAESS